jgi:hypothetical protein
MIFLVLLTLLALPVWAAGAPASPAPPTTPAPAPSASPSAPSNAPANIPTNTVVLDALDKISGRVQTISGPVGQTLAFGNLQIVARTCLTHPPEETPENSAFLEITQLQAKEPPKQVFSGWMFSSNPGISAMDNSVYDVWVLSCENKTASKAP